jgi:hypothetical protein
MIMRRFSYYNDSVQIYLVHIETKEETIHQSSERMFSFAIVFYIFWFVFAIASKVRFHYLIRLEIFLCTLFNDDVVLSIYMSFESNNQILEIEVNFDDERSE